MFVYAIVDKNNICTGFAEKERKVITKGYILVDQRDVSLIGKIFKDGEWTGETIPDNNEVTKNQLSIMEAMADQYEQQQEVNLNTYDVLATIYETVSGGVE